MRSISRVPRCQQRNNSRLRRSSRPPLDRVDPVIFRFPSNAKSPDVMPGGVDIAIVAANVSSCSQCKLCKFATQLVVGQKSFGQRAAIANQRVAQMRAGAVIASGAKQSI